MIVATIIVVIVVFLLYLYGSKIVNDKNNEMKSSSQVEDPYKSPAINKQSEDEYKKFEQMKRSLSLPDNFASFISPLCKKRALGCLTLVQCVNIPIMCLHTLLRFAMNNVASFATINNTVMN